MKPPEILVPRTDYILIWSIIPSARFVFDFGLWVSRKWVHTAAEIGACDICCGRCPVARPSRPEICTWGVVLERMGSPSSAPLVLANLGATTAGLVQPDGGGWTVAWNEIGVHVYILCKIPMIIQQLTCLHIYKKIALIYWFIREIWKNKKELQISSFGQPDAGQLGSQA